MVSAAVQVLVHVDVVTKPDGIVDKFAVLVTMSVGVAASCITVVSAAVAVLVFVGIAAILITVVKLAVVVLAHVALALSGIPVFNVASI